MIINVGPLLKREVEKIDVSFEMDVEPIEDVTFTDKATVNGVLSGNAGYMRLVLSVSVPYEGECARCLDTVKGVFNCNVERTCVTKGGISEEELEENEDEYVIIRESCIDPEDAINSTVFFEFPHKLLCSEDCLGLCPECGKRLVRGKVCGCTSEPTLDPRLAKLKQIICDDDE